MAAPPPSPETAPNAPPRLLSMSEAAGVLLLASVFFAILMAGMDGLVVSTVLPTIASDLHQRNGVTFVVSGYLVASTVAIPIFGRLSDISSRRNVFLAGLTIFIVGSALAGLSQNLGELIAFRSMQGFGGGGIFPVAVAMIAVLFPPETRAKAVSILTSAAGIAIVAGPLLGSYIVSITTWRWVFYINLPFGVFAMVILWRTSGPLRPAVRGAFDLPGAGLMAGWVAALMVALIQVSSAGWSWTDPRVLALLGATAVLLVAFLLWELRVAEPLVPLRVLRQRVMASASGIMLFTGIVFSALVTFLSLFVGFVLGGSAGDIRDAIYFLAIPLIVGAALSGPILDRYAYRTMVVPGLLLSGLVALLLGGVTAATPLWHLSFGFLPTGGLALPLIPVGFGLGLAFAGATVAVQNEARADQVGAAIGLTRFFQSLGGALGISLLTIYQSDRFHDLSRTAVTPGQVLAALATSYADVFLALAVCILLAFVSALWLRGRVRPSGSGSPAAETILPTKSDVEP
ncbi:MAG TPA: MFS transporter [Thermoplasmata archaeon]|nr:MFS transporter [Thermoplasmata archaeon]